MSKRSDFEKNPRDYYRTFDRRAGNALIEFLHRDNVTMYAEPFAGAGDLYEQLNEHKITCTWLSDLEPQNDLGYAHLMKQCDYKQARVLSGGAHAIITNPPFTKSVFHEAIEHFTPQVDCWWLMSSDWCFNKGSAKIIDKYVTDIVTIGRMRWIIDSTMSGKDNCVWLKTSRFKKGNTAFHNRRK